MFRTTSKLGKALGCAFFAAPLIGVVAWNTNSKCRADTGIFHGLSKHCPEDLTVILLVACIVIAIFFGVLLSSKITATRNPHE